MKIKKKSIKTDQETLDSLEELFVKEYIKDLNACAALRRCGKKYASNDVERVMACRMLAKIHVQDAIRTEFEKKTKKIDLKVEDIIRELYLIGTSNVAECFEKDGPLKGQLKDLHDMPVHVQRAISGFEVETPISRPGYRVTKVKLWEKTKSLELLGKYLAMWIDKKLVGTGEVDDKEFSKKFFGLDA